MAAAKASRKDTQGGEALVVYDGDGGCTTCKGNDSTTVWSASSNKCVSMTKEHCDTNKPIYDANNYRCLAGTDANCAAAGTGKIYNNVNRTCIEGNNANCRTVYDENHMLWADEACVSATNSNCVKKGTGTAYSITQRKCVQGNNAFCKSINHSGVLNPFTQENLSTKPLWSIQSGECVSGNNTNCHPTEWNAWRQACASCTHDYCTNQGTANPVCWNEQCETLESAISKSTGNICPWTDDIDTSVSGGSKYQTWCNKWCKLSPSQSTTRSKEGVDLIWQKGPKRCVSNKSFLEKGIDAIFR